MLMTYDQYDALEEEAEEEELPDDFVFPVEAELPVLISSSEGIKRILQAYYNTPQDKNNEPYRKKLLQALYGGITFVDSDCPVSALNDDKIITVKRAEKIKTRVDEMNYEMDGFYPTIKELDEYVSENTEENLAFLYWITEIPDSRLSEDDLKTKQYAVSMIQNRVK